MMKRSSQSGAHMRTKRRKREKKRACGELEMCVGWETAELPLL